MRERIEWDAHDSVPPRSDVLALQGLPLDRPEPPRIAALLEAALEVYVEVAEPRAVLAEIAPGAFAAVHRGEGRNAPASPLERIVPRADRLALFVATIGEGVSERTRELFGGRDPALGAMLDSVASAAADHLAALLGARLRERGGAGSARGFTVLPYSPGYCGWHISGQHALFASVEPEEIGVTLNASCLMRPLKSVSGVLVAGPARIHRFPPDYPFCAECLDRPCRTRIASLQGR